MGFKKWAEGEQEVQGWRWSQLVSNHLLWSTLLLGPQNNLQGEVFRPLQKERRVGQTSPQGAGCSRGLALQQRRHFWIPSVRASWQMRSSAGLLYWHELGRLVLAGQDDSSRTLNLCPEGFKGHGLSQGNNFCLMFSPSYELYCFLLLRYPKKIDDMENVYY